MGFFSSLFSSESIIEKGTDAIINVGDKLIYTQEEKADMNLKLREFHLEILKASAPFKVAQRYLAIWFSLLFGFAFLIGLVATVFNMISTYNQVLAGATQDKLVSIPIEPLFNLVIAFNLGTIVAIIIAWYFSGGVIDSFSRKKG